MSDDLDIDDTDDENEGAPTSDRKARPNSRAKKEEPSVENVAAAELRQFIERVERLEEEKANIASDIKDVYGEAKGRGYDTKAMRTIVRRRKKDANELIEEETILNTYLSALGMAILESM